ncbi:glycosyltransferase family 1 protein [Caldichromatium japonicum]|uniref:Glycosyltransferase family 1 protein n=1 Tax=Caldichromatium japonicum TaxID=2699430 RepID=A0A6G7VE91_9GAMM|nr:glycosyltransferase family 1 protein [Caldichromatium japonicum]QIK38393.1 glycosyltransferase family 1 protein [Caldichromatium japonicum]
MSNQDQALAGGPLKIAIVTETYPPEINGVANTMRYLATGMAARGHAVQVIRPRQPADATCVPDSSCEHHLVPGLPIPGYRSLRFGLPVYWRLRRLWKTNPPDLVYIATQGPLGHAALAAARSLKIPSVTGFHTHFQRYSQHYGLGLLTRQIEKRLKHFHNHSDATLVPTEELRAALIAEGFENVYVFGRGVDTEHFAPSRRSAELRRTWGCGPEDLAVLYVGRIAAEKNLALALAGFRAIQERRPEARFVLVGDGPEFGALKQQHPDLIFAGARRGDELAAHYASGDLFLFPSLTETFGNVVTEAMASGLPVIAFAYAAAGAYIRPWINGVPVALGDEDAFIAACVQCVDDPERLRRMGSEARKTMQDSGWERVLARAEELLCAVIHQRRANNANGVLSCKPG